MQEFQWFRAYVEKILEEAWNQPRVTPDEDGDYPYRYGTAACYVRLVDGEPMTVCVTASAATNILRSAKLLAELNEFNMRARLVTSYWVDGCVVIDLGLQAEAVNAQTLTLACAEVGQVAHDVGPLLAAMFDGRTPYPASDCADEIHRDER